MHLRPETRTTEVTTDKQNDAQEKANGRLMIPSTNSFLRRSSLLSAEQTQKAVARWGGAVGEGAISHNAPLPWTKDERISRTENIFQENTLSSEIMAVGFGLLAAQLPMHAVSTVVSPDGLTCECRDSTKRFSWE